MKIQITLPQVSTSRSADILLSDIKTSEQAWQAIRDIENDPYSVVGGMKQWSSGRNCELTTKAKNKIKAIEKLIEKKWPGDEFVED